MGLPKKNILPQKILTPSGSSFKKEQNIFPLFKESLLGFSRSGHEPGDFL